MDLTEAMGRALNLAAAGLGSTSPNPCVGAVVLDARGALVAEGRTEAPGGRHAEIVALAAAGDAARGGTVVTTLEPCNGSGRTGPCSHALLAAGVSHAVYALPDPLPAFAGGGAHLIAAGVQVRAGLCAEAASAIHRPWLTAATRCRPYATLKLAASLDGRAAAADGSSQWITSAAARADAHALRARVDAIVVGSGTVLADDPALTVRGTAEPRRPLRVVLDRRRRVPAGAKVLDGAAPSLRTGADLAELAAELYARGVRHLLVEGGPTVAGAFLAAGLVDEIVVYVAPALLGAGQPALATAAFPNIRDARRFAFTDIHEVGPDLRLTARPLEG